MKESVISYGELISMGISDFAKNEPEMSDNEYKLLKEDIEANGLLNPLIIYNREIYDGRHRYRAAKELSIDVPVIYADGREDAKRMAISNNRHRRHLSKHQYAMMAAKDIKASNKKMTIKESPYIVNGYVSESYVKRCLRIIKDGADYVNDVFNGKKTIEEVIAEMNKKNTKQNKEDSLIFKKAKEFLNKKLGTEVDKDLKTMNEIKDLQKIDFIKEIIYLEHKLKTKLKTIENPVPIDSILKDIKSEYEKDLKEEADRLKAIKDQKESNRIAKKEEVKKERLRKKQERERLAEEKKLNKLKEKSGENSTK